MAKSGISDLRHLPNSPNQQMSHSFPKRSFGKKTVVERLFQAAWFLNWKWLHYDEVNDKVYYFYCVKRVKENKLKPPNVEPAFVSYYYYAKQLLFAIYFLSR